MARADVMYGVTMEEFGVSKPVGMRLTQADDNEKSPKTKPSPPPKKPPSASTPNTRRGGLRTTLT